MNICLDVISDEQRTLGLGKRDNQTHGPRTSRHCGAREGVRERTEEHRDGLSIELNIAE